jgi:nicotinamide-nucleotide amidase
MSKEVDHQLEQLLKLIPNYFFGYDGDTLASVVGEILVRKNARLAVAESCTGGYLAHLITEVPGSSDWFNGGVVAYSNEIKEKLLDVDAEALDQYSAVSLEVVESMVRGAMKKFDTDYAIATSGIAGPSGGTPEKPVGTVWIAIGNKEEIIARKFSFGKDRGRTIIRASQTGLNMLRNFLMK